MTDESGDRHLDPLEMAAYVDGTAADEERHAIRAHLAACATCRAEALDVTRIIGTFPGRRRVAWRLWVPAAAAAVALLLIGAPPLLNEQRARTRDEPLTMTLAPRPIAPSGVVDSAGTLVWSAVPRADRYRIRLFDADGTVLWEHETADTVAAPGGAIVRARTTYYWKVAAHTGFERWSDSDLVEFSVRRGAAP